MKKFWLTVSALTMLASVGLCQNSPTVQATDDRIGQLIKQLGSDKYAEREKAFLELETIGQVAVPLLRLAAKVDNPEVRQRSRDLVKRIEYKLAAEALLAPKMVRLNLKEIPVIEAVRELTRQSGYAIEFEGDLTPLQTRKVTLATERVAFWVAFDKLCEHAKLVQVLDAREISAPPKTLGPLYHGPSFDTITVRDGVPQKIPTYYCGNLRLRVNMSRGLNGVQAKEGEALLILKVSGEPCLQRFSVTTYPWITKALDDQGQMLTVNSSHPSLVNLLCEGRRMEHHVAQVLNLSNKNSECVTELTGTLAIQALGIRETYISVGDIANAMGKPVVGAKGGLVEILSIEKSANGTTYATIRYEAPKGHYPAQGAWGGIAENFDETRKRQLQIAGAVNHLRLVQAINNGQVIGNRIQVDTQFMPTFNEGLPVLADAQGRPRLQQLLSASFDANALNDGRIIQVVNLAIRPTEDVGPPTQLLLYGHQMVSANVPFRFENIPLP